MICKVKRDDSNRTILKHSFFDQRRIKMLGYYFNIFLNKSFRFAKELLFLKAQAFLKRARRKLLSKAKIDYLFLALPLGAYLLQNSNATNRV